MSDPPPAPAAPSDPPPAVAGGAPDLLSGRPDARLTWLNQELELLISAAIAFSLFQLPGRIDALFDRLEAHFGEALFFALLLGYEMALLVVYGLIATFCSHFLLRSFWVGLLGLRSAFPEGIDWPRLELGPIAESYYRPRLPTLEVLEHQVDRAASALFAFLFLFLIFIVQGVLSVAALALVASLVAWLLPVADVAEARKWIFLGLAGLLFLASLIHLSIDKLLLKERWRDRVPQWARRLAVHILALLSRLAAFRVYLPVFFTLSSRSSRAKMQGLLIGFTYVLLGVFLLVVLVREGILRVDSYVYFPVRLDEGEIEARHYDDQRPASAPTDVPTIPSDVVEGDYLRLFVPFDPRRDNERVAALCPEIEPFRTDAAHLVPKRSAPPTETELAELHRCFDRLSAIELDGEPLVGADWLFYTHPTSGARGRIAYLPTAGLAPGQHLLVVRRTPTPVDDPERPPQPFFIPFWR